MVLVANKRMLWGLSQSKASGRFRGEFPGFRPVKFVSKLLSLLGWQPARSRQQPSGEVARRSGVMWKFSESNCMERNVPLCHMNHDVNILMRIIIYNCNFI